MDSTQNNSTQSSQVEFQQQPGKFAKVKGWFTAKFVPAVAKAGNERHIAAIRDSFGTMIPIIIAGSIGILIGTIGFGGWGSGYVSLLGLICKAANPSVAWADITAMMGNTANNWGKVSTIFSSIFNVMNTATIGMMSIYFVFLFGYYLALGKNNKQPIVGGFVALASFVIACMGQVTSFMGATGLITAIVFGILSSEIYVRLCNVDKFNLKLPDSVPPAVGKSFQVFLPTFFTLAIIAILNLTVLMPAVFTEKLYVTGISYETFGSGLTFDDGAWQAAFQPGNAWAQQNPELLSQLYDNFKVGGQQFGTWLNGLNSSDNGFVATALANYGGASGFNLSTLVSLTDHASVKAVWDQDLGNCILSIQWNAITIGSSSFGLGEAIYQFFTLWFIGFATGNGGLALAILFAFFVSFFWFFGIHGSNIMGGIFEPIWTMILLLNAALVTSMGSYEAAAATGSMGVFGKSFFDSFMYVGGSGATLGLLICTFLFSKRRDNREVAKYATPAGIFQINEPAIFGYPIVLNAVYFAPFVIAPIANLLIAYIFSPAALGWMHYPYIVIPWTTPWFLGGLLSTLSPAALIPAILVLAADIFIYFPFVLIDNRKFFKRVRNESIEMYKEEIKYAFNKYYRLTVSNKTKYENKLKAADHALASAQNRVDFVKSLPISKARKDKMATNYLQKGEAKKAKILQQAEALKQKLDAKETNSKANLIELNNKLVKKLQAKNEKIQHKISLNNEYKVKGESQIQFNNDIIEQLA